MIAVVVHHLNLRLRFDKSGFLPDDLNRAFFWTGSYSVKIFFVISGFLITSTMLARWGEIGATDVRGFYRLRFARIAPCLLGLLTILSILHLTGVTGFVINPKRTTLPRALIAALTFHVNWLEPKYGYLPGAWDILWSLSIEEAFYLAYPLLCRFVKPMYLVIVAVSLMVVGPSFRTVLAPSEMATDYGYLANMDCIAIGCVVAAVPIRLGKWAAAAGWGMLFLIVFFRSIVFTKPVYSSGLDVSLLALAVALSIQYAPARIPLAAPIAWFGRSSYEIYLTHMFVVTLGTQWFTAHHMPINLAPAWFAGSVLAAGLLGYAVARWYSEPLNRRLRGKPLLTATANV